MDWVATFSGITGSVVAIGGLIYTIIRAQNDKNRGIIADANEGRRDTIADRDGLINQLQEERDRRDQLIREERQERQAQVNAISIQIARLERELIAERTYTNLLVMHIWEGKAPPPPDRPTPIEITA